MHRDADICIWCRWVNYRFSSRRSWRDCCRFVLRPLLQFLQPPLSSCCLMLLGNKPANHQPPLHPTGDPSIPVKPCLLRKPALQAIFVARELPPRRLRRVSRLLHRVLYAGRYAPIAPSSERLANSYSVFFSYIQYCTKVWSMPHCFKNCQENGK